MSMRRTSAVPCAILDEKGKAHPANVDCPHKCGGCGFNPAEMERRFATGSIVQVNGLQQLRFRRRRDG